MSEIKDAEVTPKRFMEWLKENMKYTWFTGEGGGYMEEGYAIMKYIRPSIDTRDMMIFNIEVDDRFFDFRDEELKEGEDILDLLSRKMKNYEEPKKDPVTLNLEKHFREVDVAQVKIAAKTAVQKAFSEAYYKICREREKFNVAKDKVFVYHDLKSAVLKELEP